MSCFTLYLAYDLGNTISMIILLFHSYENSDIHLAMALYDECRRITKQMRG